MTRFLAYNHDQRVKAIAQKRAQELTQQSGRKYIVEYYDSYDDYSVRGEYVVRAA